MRHNNSTTRRGGFSLLETTIGLAVMGIGLIMVAAIFPVALTQHRESIDQARAMDMIPQASAILRSKVRPELLWYDLNLLADGYDSPWYVMPMSNIEVAGTWSFNSAPDEMLIYTNQLNIDYVNGTAPFSRLHFDGVDILSDRIMPLNDRSANESPNRLVWTGFYRQLANGGQTYATAICKQRRDQTYLRQDLSQANPLIEPQPLDPSSVAPLRFPVPWRVTLALGAARGELLINNPTPAANSYTLAQLAPVGSKIMIRGVPDDVSRSTPVPSGRILTITETFPVGSVLVREDISDIISTFDVWVFPPPAVGTVLTNESPVLEWKESL